MRKSLLFLFSYLLCSIDKDTIDQNVFFSKYTQPFLRLLGSLLVVATITSITATTALADTFTYDDQPPVSLPFDDNSTVICNEPLTRIFTIGDNFLVDDIDLGFNADHDYRSDIRLVLESPKGTRVEVVVEFDATPEDGGTNYDILLDDDVTAPLNDDTPDDTAAPYYDRRVQPTNPFTAFANERATGIWKLEICDAGVADSGSYNRSRLIFDGTPIPAGPIPNTISGLVFRDYNADGRYQVRAEGGIPAIAVSAYDDAGTPIATTVTDAAGEYALAIPDGTAVRLEFGALSDYLQPGPAGPDSATTVTFVTSPADDVRVGLANPGQHAQNSSEMSIALPQYHYGANNGPYANGATVLAYREEDGSHDLLLGDGADTSVYDGAETVLAHQEQTGTIWGMAYDRLHKQLLGAAFVKRHSGLGTTGNPTTIYRFDPTSENATEWFTLDPNRLDPHGSTVDWVKDFAVYDAVGKEGWGDLDMSDDLKTLYGVDLGRRQLVLIPVQDDGSAGTPTEIDILPALPADLVGSGTGQCPSAADLRPFGLGVNDGTLYLGVVCTAESTVAATTLPIQAPTNSKAMGTPPGDLTKIHAYVFAWNGSVSLPTFSKVLDFPLRYPRGCASYNQQAGCEAKYPGEWLPWASAFPYSSDGTTSPAGTTKFESFYPQALLSNIEFTNGNMVLFLMDRFGHQVGPFAQSPYGEELSHLAAHSDILFACKKDDGWIMESVFSNDPSCDTGIRAYIRGEERADEYFGEDTYRARYALHGDVGFGAGLAIPGRETVIHAVFDPIYAMDGTGDTLFDGGLHWYTVADGHWRKSIRVYNNISGNLPVEGIFSKAIGLGDIVALTDIPPIEIGNRVWLDSNGDGIQSPSEAGIAGVAVELRCPLVGPDGIAGNLDDETVVATAQTDDEGHYYFSSAAGVDTSAARYGLTLINATTCTVQIPNAAGTTQQTALLDLQLTETDDQTPTVSGNDQNDSDGRLSGLAATVDLTLGGPGVNDHTYDFGFSPILPTPLHSLGNQVWFDGNDNAQIDTGETGAVGVALTLYPTDGTPISSTTTTANGLYLFDDLPAGDYRVGVDTSNFAPGAIFEGCRSSSETLDEDDSNLDGDNNDNGLLIGGLLRSGLVTLGDDEPLGESPDNDPTTLDNRANLTVDFGIFCGHSLGNQVWFDANDNAQVDSGETGATGVALTLYDSSDTPISTTTTAANGLYLFDELPAGDYRVDIDASNFAPGAIFEGCRSSNETLDEDDPNLDGDNNDNGLLITGLFRSGLLTLGDDEPLGETSDNDPTTPDARENLTLDFGIFCGHSLGNQVWFDVNNNTLIDEGEVGIDNVTLTLFTTNGTLDERDDQAITQTATADGGFYLFDGLPAGDYYVEIDSANFGFGGMLQSCLSSNEVLDEDLPNLDQDNNDNGIQGATTVRSGVVHLGDNEPLAEDPDNDAFTADQRENLTVDFGCYLTVSLGNRVWIDDGRNGGVADNGLIDGGEVGVADVILALLDGNKEPLHDLSGNLITTTTDLAGYYLFSDLLPGDYVVQVLPINFQDGGVLAGYSSSSSTEEDPNQDGDTNDNGIDSATPAIDGICSNVVTLLYTTEPGQEPDPGQLPDRSLDSNSNLTVDFGFFAHQPTALDQAPEPLEQHRLFLPWVVGQ